MLVCHGSSDRQVAAIADGIEERLRESLGVKPSHVEGRRTAEWILLDYIDLVVHVFLEEKRRFYALDRNVRMLSKEILELNGYRVIEAVDGEDAVKKFMQHQNDVQLLLLDVVMPKKNGKEVYNEITKIRPHIKALFISGYTSDIIQKKGIIEEGLNFIYKPVPMNVLLQKVRDVLDA